jgi:peroxiredoxin
MSDAPPPVAELAEPPSRWSGLLRSVVLPLALLVVILGGLWYWDSRGGGSSSNDEYGIVDLPDGKNPTGEEPSAEEGRAAPDFILEQPGGGTLRLSDLQGQPVLVNFWAHWCAPCRREVPDLVEADETYGSQGLVILGVNLQEPDDIVLDFAEEFGITYPLVIDRDGELSDVWRLGGPVQGIPTSYFIDETGVIRAFYYGPINDDALRDRLAQIGVTS